MESSTRPKERTRCVPRWVKRLKNSYIMLNNTDDTTYVTYELTACQKGKYARVYINLDLECNSKRDLRQLARELGLPSRARSKDALIEIISGKER